MTSNRHTALTQVVSIAMLGIASLFQPHAYAQASWQPSGPIRLIVPYPPGGGTDVAARLLASGVKDKLGQPLVVENRPGANGVIAANYVYAAKPDGLTLLFGVSDVLSTTPHINPKVVKFDPNRFSAVASVGRGGYVLVAPSQNAKASLEDVLNEVKSPASEVNYGHWGAGSMSQMAMEQFKIKADMSRLMAVPFGGSAALLNAVLGAHVNYAFIPPGLAVSGSDKLKMYASSSAERIPLVPDVPTLKELGYDMQAETLYGVFAPPGTPREAIEFLNAEMLAVTKEPDFIARLIDLGYSPLPMSPAEMDEYVHQEIGQWGTLVEQAKLQVE